MYSTWPKLRAAARMFLFSYNTNNSKVVLYYLMTIQHLNVSSFSVCCQLSPPLTHFYSASYYYIGLQLANDRHTHMIVSIKHYFTSYAVKKPLFQLHANTNSMFKARQSFKERSQLEWLVTLKFACFFKNLIWHCW